MIDLELLSNKKIYTVLDFIRANICWKDNEGRYLGCNKMALVSFGLTHREQIIGKTDYDFMASEEADRISATDKKAMDNGYCCSEEILTTNGIQKTYLNTKTTLYDESGKLAGIFGTAVDITATKHKMEEEKNAALREEELKISQIMDMVPAHIYWKYKNEYYLGCNEAQTEFIGTDIVGKTEYDIFASREAFDKIREVDQYVLDHGFFSGEEIATNHYGVTKIYFSSKKRLLNASGEVIGLVGATVDISDAKEKECLQRENQTYAMLQEQQEQFGQILDLVPAHIYWKHKNEYYLGCNKSQREFIGNAVVIGKNEYDFMPKEEADKVHESDQYVLDHGSFSGEEIGTDAQGGIKTYFSSKSRLTNSKGEVIGVVGITVDISDTKEKERLQIENQTHLAVQAQQAKFRKDVDQVVHDIRSPLMSLEMLATHCMGLPEKEREGFRQIATTIADIANNLLNKYSAQADDAQADPDADVDAACPVVISSLLQQLLSEKKYEYKNAAVKFQLELSQDNAFVCVQAQPLSLKRSLSNLINNAVQALENQTGEVGLCLAVSAERVEIRVTDNGRGMPDEVKDKILQGVAVTVGKVNGYGIGMQQVLGTLERNHGELKIDSTLGCGTTISLGFSRVPAPNWLATEVHLKSNSLLVLLDDDDSIHFAWDNRLEPIKQAYPQIEVQHFRLATEAIAFIEQLPELDWPRVFLLSDYELINQDLNGLQVIARCQPHPALLVTSHYNNRAIRAEATRLNTSILPKQLAIKAIIHIDDAAAEEAEETVALPLKPVDFVLLDDDVQLLSALSHCLLNEHVVDTYSQPEALLEKLSQYAKETKIVVDNNYNNSTLTGMSIINLLRRKGYTQLYLLTGQQPDEMDGANRAIVLCKKDIQQVKERLLQPYSLTLSTTSQTTELAETPKANSELQHAWKVVDHDLITPMVVMRMRLDTLQEEVVPCLLEMDQYPNPTEEQTENAKQLQAVAEGLDVVRKSMRDVRQSLDRYRYKFLPFAMAIKCPLLISQCVQEAIEDYDYRYELQDKSRIHFADEGTQAAMILGEKEAIRIVIIELLSNADYALRIARPKPAQMGVWFNARIEQQHYHLHVRNNGAPIKPTDLPRLFEPGFTTKTSALGLGLTFCREAIQKMGGEIRVNRRTEGDDVEFLLTFPLCVDPMATSECEAGI